MRRLSLGVVALLVTVAATELVLRSLVEPCDGASGCLWGIRLPPYRIVAAESPAGSLPDTASASTALPLPAAREPTGQDLRGVLELHPTIGHLPSRGVTSPLGWSPQNAVGARSRSETTKNIASGTSRVLVFGDSFARGSRVPLEDSWPHLLGEKQRDREIVNFGVDAYGLGQTLLYYRLVRDRVEADRVVLVWVPLADLWRDVNTMRSLGEDWDSYTVQPRFVLEDGRLRFVESPYADAEEIYEENRVATSPRLLAHLERYDAYYSAWVHAPPPPVFGASILYGLFARSLHLRFKKELDRDLKWGPFDLDSEAMHVSAALLATFSAEVRSQGADFLLVVLPEQATLQNVAHIEGRGENWDALVSIACAAVDSACFDLLPAFLAHPEERWDRGYDGSHFGPRANAVIADGLDAFLRRQDVTPARKRDRLPARRHPSRSNGSFRP